MYPSMQWAGAVHPPGQISPPPRQEPAPQADIPRQTPSGQTPKPPERQLKWAAHILLECILACFLLPANEVCKGYVFTGVCHSVHRGGHVWLLPGGMRGCSGGMHGCSGGACMVALGGHAWLLLGGACVVAPGGACMVAQGGMHGCSGGGMHGFFDEIRSMSGQYASYWNAYLFFLF